MNKRALIFGGGILGLIIIIAVGVWFASLFNNEGGAENGVDDLFSSLFPFGFGGGGRGGATIDTGEQEPGENAGPVPLLREISRRPISGAHFEENGMIRWVERESGHVFETAPDSFTVVRLSNTTIPGIQRVIWLDDSQLILQYLDENASIKNFLGMLASTTADQTLTGRFLDEFIALTPTKNENEVVTLSKGAGGTRIEITNIEKPGKRLVFSSPLRSWNLVPNTERVFIKTAPSSGLGYVYEVENNQPLKKIFGGVPGLMTVVNESGSFFAFSGSNNTGITLAIYDVAASATRTLPIATLAEKCAWEPGDTQFLFCGIPSSFENISMEDWLMGFRSFTDSAWVIHPTTGVAKLMANLEEDAGRAIDVIHPNVSPDGSYVIFVNKNDLSLWSLRLSE